MEKNLELFVTDKRDLKVVEECEKLALQNHRRNGGTLRCLGLVESYADYLVYAVKDNKIVGFVAVTKDWMGKNDLYLMQSAIDNNYKGQRIAPTMYDYILKHSKGYDYVTAHIMNYNTNSQKSLNRNYKFNEVDACDTEKFYYITPDEIKQQAKVSELLSLKKTEKQFNPITKKVYSMGTGKN